MHPSTAVPNTRPLPPDPSTYLYARERAAELRERLGLLTEEDLMFLLSVSDSTLQQWRMSGAGPRYAKLGKTIFYRVDDVQTWISGNCWNSTADGRNATAV